MPPEGFVLLTCLALYALYAVFRIRAARRREAEEDAAFAVAIEEGGALEYVDQRLETLVSAAPPVFWFMAAYGVIEARSIDVPWRSCLAAAAAYVALSLMVMRRVDVRASRGAALLLIVVAVGFGVFILVQSPDYRWGGGPEWPSAFVAAAVAALPGFSALGLTYQFHRLGGDLLAKSPEWRRR